MSRRPACCTSRRSGRPRGGWPCWPIRWCGTRPSSPRTSSPGSPQYGDEWGNLLGLVHALAGATGLLAMAEENAMPRILEDLTGPLSRAGDVVAMQRRTAVSHLALPPGPGEASMATLGNKLY